MEAIRLGADESGDYIITGAYHGDKTAVTLANGFSGTVTLREVTAAGTSGPATLLLEENVEAGILVEGAVRLGGADTLSGVLSRSDLQITVKSGSSLILEGAFGLSAARNLSLSLAGTLKAVGTVSYGIAWHNDYGASADHPGAIQASGGASAYGVCTDSGYRTVTRFGAKICRVGFDSAGGSKVSACYVEAGHAVERPADPQKTGYLFDGWYLSNGTAYQFSTPVSGDMTLRARWRPEGGTETPPGAYDVRFESFGGSAVAAQTVAEGGFVRRPEDPVRDGYTFMGWYADAALTRAWDFAGGAVAADLTLYASWKEESGNQAGKDPEENESQGGVPPGEGNSQNEAPSGETGQSGEGDKPADESANPGTASPEGGNENGNGDEEGKEDSNGGGNSPHAPVGTANDTSDSSSGGRTERSGSPALSTNTSGNVGAGGMVSSAIVNEIRAAANSRAIVRTRNAVGISPAILREMARAAASEGKTAVLHADTTDLSGTVVQGRLYLSPSLLGDADGEIRLGVYTDSVTRITKSRFEQFFDNRVAVIRCEQQGGFGARVEIAARVDLSALNTKTLRFYSYDRESNTYQIITEPDYRIDPHGYLRFSTDLGGDIIVTDRALVARE